MTSTNPTSAAAGGANRPPEVIAWLRDPGRLGKTVFAEWSLKAGGPDGAKGYRSFEVSKDTHVGSDTAFIQRTRFAHEIAPDRQSDAVAIADEAARLISTSPALTQGKLRQLDPDDFFYGPLTDTGSFAGNQRPDIAVGEGKILIDDGTARRVYAGRLEDMKDILATTRSAVSQIMDLPADQD